MPGIHLSSPGLTLNPSVILGRIAVLSAAEAAILQLANLTHWWRGTDAVVDGSGAMSWVDRKAGALLTGGVGSAPTLETISGKQAVKFDGSVSAQYLSGLGTIPLTNNFTWLIRLRPTSGFPTGIILNGYRNADNDGPYAYLFSDGRLLTNLRSGQQGGTATGALAAGTTNTMDWSYDGTIQKYGKDGTQTATYTPATSGAAPTPDAFRVGASKAAALPLKAHVFDILQFNAPLRDGVGDHATQLSTAVANLAL